MERSFEESLARIEKRESHLWMVALALLLIFVGVTLAGFYIFFAQSDESSDPSLTIKALAGLSILVVLFCVYVVHTRADFSRVRKLFEAQAMRDSLTGLLNRQTFPKRLGQEVVRTDRGGGLLGIVLCDLDNFKLINDTYGHPVGDQMLRLASEAILRATRGTDLVFRWGGDEVLVLLSPTERSGVMVVANRIRYEVERVRQANSHSATLSISIGIALYPEHGRDIDELINLADKALYIAKRSGNKVHVGEEELPLDAAAVDFVFQPVVDSRSGKTIGHEVLSRDPSGLMNVRELFRSYEAVGQLNDFKRMIFLRQLETAKELELGRVFINTDFELLGSLQAVPKPDGLEVVLEISESETVGNIEECIGVVASWRENGYKFAIDDFGAGFMSIPFVARLLPSFIKMDRSAIVEASTSDQFSGFLRDMVLAMRNYSDEGIIAEGIETEAELATVNKMGVHQVQGHLTGRPRAITHPPDDK
ncbi:MAG: diguanylate cyclase [Acidobacteriota bacterium]|nr:diguanylate cyclase [Acidobacteriota bacterium]